MDSFECVICEHSIDLRWNFPNNIQTIPPVCRYCEKNWCKSTPTRGSFKDRRIAAQISALAEALENEARVIHYRRYGYAAERL